MRVLIPLLTCLGLVLNLASCSSGETPPPGAAERPPNILLILADDLGNNDVGAFGDGSASTPHIDALAAGGVRFHRHYAQPTCRPARVELLTGKAASRVGAPPHFRGIGAQHVTLAEALRDGGYATHHIGKWHLGEELPSAWPDAQGFQHWYGFLHALMTQVGSMQPPGSTYRNPWLQGNDTAPAQTPGHLTDILTDAATARLRSLAGSEQPWFINLWYFAPHGPIEPDPAFSSEFPATPEGEYLALVAGLDAGVGRLMQALRDTGQEENTLVVLVSDNGGTERFRRSNRPYFGQKATFTEGGLRTPLVLSRPGTLGSVDVHSAVFIRDLMPTLLAYAGLESPPGLDGRDFRPQIIGEPVARPVRYYWDNQLAEYASWGALDLERDYFISNGDLQRREAGAGHFGDVQPSAPELREQLWADYRRWQRAVSVLDLERSVDASGASLEGDDYRRTPGYGGWSIQLPLDLGRDFSALAQQPGHWKLQAGQGRIYLELPGVTVEAGAETAGCQLLTVATYYRWAKRAPGRSAATVKLYLGDVLIAQQSQRIHSDILVDDYPATRLAADVGDVVVANTLLVNGQLQHYRAAGAGDLNCPG